MFTDQWSEVKLSKKCEKLYQSWPESRGGGDLFNDGTSVIAKFMDKQKEIYYSFVLWRLSM